MADPVWGNLEKAQDDDQTIEEAIAAAIAVHKADSDAHTLTGQSLETHKGQEVIDHPAESLVADKYADQSVENEKFKYNQFKIESVFESLDAFSQYTSDSGSISQNLASLELKTGSTINSVASVYGEAWTEGDAVNYLKNPRFIIIAKISATTNQKVYLVSGGYQLNGFGFYVEDGTLYAVHYKDGTPYTTDISSGITLNAWHRYKAVYTSGSKIEFYVDDVLKATHESNLPEDGSDAADEINFCTFRITNTAAESKRVILKQFILQQDS